MEKDIGKISKNPDTDIVIRVDDFGGKTGLTIREFVKGERYTGFTKAGTRIPAEKFKEFKQLINAVDENALVQAISSSSSGNNTKSVSPGEKKVVSKKSAGQKSEVVEEQEF